MIQHGDRNLLSPFIAYDVKLLSNNVFFLHVFSYQLGNV